MDGRLPFLPDPEEARAMYATCVLYRDPDDPGHTVRLMPGVPESPVKEARAPYVVHAWNGVYLDGNGRPAVSERESYIPLECFTGAVKNLPPPWRGKAAAVSWAGFWRPSVIPAHRNGTGGMRTGRGVLHGRRDQAV